MQIHLIRICSAFSNCSCDWRNCVMKSKKLSIIAALLWLALIAGWYVFSAPHFYHQSSILAPANPVDIIVSVCWLIIPPLFWWIPRKLLIRSGKWHPIGTIVFCIGNALCFPCLLALAHIETIYDTILVNYSTVFLGILIAGMLLLELLSILFKKNPAQQHR